MSTFELLRELERSGGSVYVDGRRLCARRVPKRLASLVKIRAKELAELIAERGRVTRVGPIDASVPHCPKCGSHALYRATDGVAVPDLFGRRGADPLSRRANAMSFERCSMSWRRSRFSVYA